MKKHLSLLFAAAMMIVLSVACDKGAGNGNDPEPEPPVFDTIDVPFEEYSLEGTTSQWTNLDNGNGKLVVIDSDAELSEYIDGDDYPAIDFTRKTLLRANGATTNGVYEKSVKNFQLLSENKYRLDIEIALNPTDVAEGWRLTILVDKLSEQSSVELNVTTTEWQF